MSSKADLVFLERKLGEATAGISDDAMSERYALNNVLHEMMPEPKCVQPPNYCMNLAAAVELVERVKPDHEWRVGVDFENQRAWAELANDHWDEAMEWLLAEAKTPALALCLALVRSFQKENGNS